MATVTRIFEFDAAHRVMNEKVKCFNLHGHRFKVEVTFEYSRKEALGYAIDFKEIKRIVGAFIDEHFDHACILNPLDKELISLCEKNNWRHYEMGFGVEKDENPSAENIALELFYIINTLFHGSKEKVELKNIRLYETPNCWVDVDSWYGVFPTDKAIEYILNWRNSMGEVYYDIRDNASEKK